MANIASDADTARVREYTWMCRTELDRERLVTTVRGVGKARALMFVVLAGVVVGSAGQTVPAASRKLARQRPEATVARNTAVLLVCDRSSAGP